MIRCNAVTFAREQHTILDAVSLDLAPGERICLLGRNGAGKSTLMKILAGQLKPDSGEVLLDGESYKKLGRNKVRRQVQMVLQEPDDQIFATSVAQDVAYGPKNMGMDTDVTETLEALGIADLADHVPHQLSFGQRKRVALAGALAMRPRFLLLDEPTAGLDPAGTTALIQTLDELDATLLFSTHDVNAAVRLATRFLVLEAGQLYSGDITNSAFMHSCGLEVPWAPVVSKALGRTVTRPEDLR